MWTRKYWVVSISKGLLTVLKCMQLLQIPISLAALQATVLSNLDGNPTVQIGGRGGDLDTAKKNYQNLNYLHVL